MIIDPQTPSFIVKVMLFLIAVIVIAFLAVSVIPASWIGIHY